MSSSTYDLQRKFVKENVLTSKFEHMFIKQYPLLSSSSGTLNTTDP